MLLFTSVYSRSMMQAVPSPPMHSDAKLPCNPPIGIRCAATITISLVNFRTFYIL